MTRYGKIALALLAATTGLGQVATAWAGPVYTGVEGAAELGVSGYDPVSYFRGDGVPVKGLAEHSVTHKGAAYQFASAANAQAFAADPDRFLPQYGGHCAWAMARGYLAPGDATQYRIVDGRLFLNYNAEVKAMWLKDIPGFIASGDKNWPGFPDDAKFGN